METLRAARDDHPDRNSAANLICRAATCKGSTSAHSAARLSNSGIAEVKNVTRESAKNKHEQNFVKQETTKKVWGFLQNYQHAV